ncbi:alkylated dna repair protein : Putative uncharacterized protein OS=Aureococcus anophagefferens GN=AURANDRAFT_70982 PE=4 SV=1: 2OG-FeII_Oxy [Gemmata massiliana]|uniref:Fe2OG dioxygenase domain-containing protein n=1 Tax=Gemmata massiliana TaxID=1210884 RepID=A0A6P2CVV3_9BACT|nr:alpha-ketoglutarate-dependent dioxygenase AlkB [Gemmata massiliana]VTR93033.1 alkylated dna repair protein : Putative uncharacterized protein OS=Aureococcus anophagefferens GN=AURANDRAFT_70982 PE=4 SV=1: 2OG-FeII_Oxy [Gemmata massiliana]
MPRQQFRHIPGLFLDTDYFALDQCSRLVLQSLALYERLEAAVGGADGSLETAHIPQPAYVRSAEHNLKSEEHFARVALTEESQRTIRCEYFPRYGEDGHALAYFQRNANLPDFVARDLVPGVHGLVASEGFVPPDQELVWKLTMNFYQRVNGKVAGFPFHVDIPANGVVTMIINVQREVLFQIAKGDAVTDIPLPVGALLLLSGESRYVWKHRVLPADAPASGGAGAIERVSLVLGFQ